MIKSKEEYKYYLEMDRIALGQDYNLRGLLFNDIWKFQRCLRQLEYLTNCKKNIFLRKIVAMRFRYLSKKLGFTIPINVFGPGLSIAHYGTIVVNSKAKIGKNETIINANAKKIGLPTTCEDFNITSILSSFVGCLSFFSINL